MSTTILGKKMGMLQLFDEKGNCVPVTLVEAGPCVVVQKRSPAKHKYSAIQIGFEQVPGRKLSKPNLGVFERADLKPMRHLREVRLSQEEVDNYKIGDNITVSIFTPGEKVDITGTSKGRGYQGVVRRHHMKGNTKTRGTHEHRRHPGSIGMREHPGHVIKGKKLPGQMGNKRVTTQNLSIFKVEEEKNLLYIDGPVPGANGGLVVIKKAVKIHTPAEK
jgi:large subunit ribosomal protein L3